MCQTELGNLKLVEDTLDSLIKSCAQQLFDITDDTENAAYPFTTELPHNDSYCSRKLLGSSVFWFSTLLCFLFALFLDKL